MINKKMMWIIILVSGLLSGCQSTLSTDGGQMMIENDDQKIIIQTEKEKIPIFILNHSVLSQLSTEFPIHLKLKHLNGNELYADLPFFLSSDPEAVMHINKGEVMLFGSNTIVVFYESHDTNYEYTRIGRIENISQLDTLKNSNNVLLTNK